MECSHIVLISRMCGHIEWSDIECSHIGCSHIECSHIGCSHIECSHRAVTHRVLTHRVLTHRLLTHRVLTHGVLTHAAHIEWSETGQKRVRNESETGQKQPGSWQRDLGPTQLSKPTNSTSSSGGDVVKCDVRLPYRMYVASLHFVFTLFGVSCRDNF